MSSMLSPGKAQAEKAARLQEAQIDKQKQVEDARNAKETDAVARRMAVATSKTKGRRSLISTSQSAGTSTLGGT